MNGTRDSIEKAPLSLKLSTRYPIENVLLKEIFKYTNDIEKDDGNMSETNDNATCIVDLNKVKEQYKIWQESVGGN